jgi:hypothetical protein
MSANKSKELQLGDRVRFPLTGERLRGVVVGAYEDDVKVVTHDGEFSFRLRRNQVEFDPISLAEDQQPE